MGASLSRSTMGGLAIAHRRFSRGFLLILLLGACTSSSSGKALSLQGAASEGGFLLVSEVSLDGVPTFFGALVLKNTSSRTLEIRELKALDVDDGLTVVGYRLMRPSENGGAYEFKRCGSFPPKDIQNYPVSGFVLPPNQVAAGMIAVVATKAGELRLKRVSVTYREGDATRRQIFPFQVGLNASTDIKTKCLFAEGKRS
jgi:hypothetical protein